MINLFEENQNLKVRNEEVVVGTTMSITAVVLIVLLLYPTVAH